MKRFIILILFGFFGVSALAQTKEEADRLHQLGRECIEKGQFAEGREYSRQAMEMRKALFGEVNEGYITSLNNYAYALAAEKQFAQAAEFQQKVLDLCVQLPAEHPLWGTFNANMGRYLLLQDKDAESAPYLEAALPAVEKFGPAYEYVLQALAYVYDKTGDRKNFNRIFALMEEHNRHELTLPCEEPSCMVERAQYYHATGDDAAAKEWFLKALNLAQTDGQKKDVYGAYASFLFSTNAYEEAAEYRRQEARLLKKMLGETDEYASLLYKAGTYAFLAKQYQEALEDYKVCLQYYQGVDTPSARKEEANCYEHMGHCYQGLNDFQAAIPYRQKVVDYYAQYEPDSPDYPKALEKLANMEKYAGLYEDSRQHRLAAQELYEKQGIATDEDSAKNKQNRELERIIKEETESLDLTKEYLGNYLYANSLGVIAGCYLLKEDYQNAVQYFKQYLPALRTALQESFLLQNEKERMTLWAQQKDHIDNISELLVSLPAGNDAIWGDVCALAYDAALLSKGILLNSSIEFEQVIYASGDDRLKNLYRLVQENQAEIDRLRQNAASDDDFEKMLSLSQENQEKVLQLYRGCAEYASFTDYLSYDWQNVRAKLSVTDVAIEFQSIHYELFDDRNYMVAMALTHDAPYPVAIPVCTLAQATYMLSDEGLFTREENLIWGPLSTLLEGKKRICFSADGAFNSLGIEYLPFNGAPLSDQFAVYRLSSTKELCYKRSRIRYTSAELFGDINYNEESTGSPSPSGSLRSSAGMEQLDNLAETAREIDGIGSALKQKVKTIRSKRDTLASVAAFKALSGSGVNIIHVATHGLYDADAQTESESMVACRLAFAGANLSDEGSLSATEIAGMNLRECDLAVLSACETALGKLGTDGVFGLQRGFKNAGVRSLLMSVKPVYDTSTADLMIAFYKYLAHGKGKREALTLAQKDLRAKGYTDAKYWATFILLDALE